MATTNDLKNGMVLNLDGQLWQVIWFQHHKPGKGGAVVRTKLKNIESGKTVDKTFNADVKVEVANVDKRTMQYLYNDGTSYVFMDTGTYDQLEVAPEIVGDADELPAGEPGGDRRHQRRPRALHRAARLGRARGRATPSPACRATAPPAAPSRPRSRPAHEINVPLFITTGEKIKVDTRDSLLPGPRHAPDDRPLQGPQARPRRALRLRGARPVRRRGARRARRRAASRRSTTTPSTLVRGVIEHQARIDELLATYAQGWTLERMPAVDRNVLRLGVFEVLYVDDVPDAVAVTEAMALVRDLSTDESPGLRQRRPRQHRPQQGLLG